MLCNVSFQEFRRQFSSVYCFPASGWRFFPMYVNLMTRLLWDRVEYRSLLSPHLENTEVARKKKHYTMHFIQCSTSHWLLWKIWYAVRNFLQAWTNVVLTAQNCIKGRCNISLISLLEQKKLRSFEVPEKISKNF